MATNFPAKRKRNFFQNAPKRKQYTLEPGIKGFLCSCNFKEKECVRESYKILNEYADKLQGTEATTQDDDDNEESIEDELQKEIQQLSSENQAKRFQVVESGAKNCLFIRTTVEDPVKLAEAVVMDIIETKQQKTRFLLRLVPIEITCKANVDDIKKNIEPLMEKYFKDEAQTFSVIFNHRNNNKISKDAVIKELADMVFAQRADHKVNLTEAEVSIIVEIIKGIALLAVVPNYIKHKKYNLHMICEPDLSSSDAPGEVPTEPIVENEDGDENADKSD